MKLTDPELINASMEVVRKIFENYSIDVTFKDTESYFDHGLAVIAIIKPRFHQVEFHMRMEIMDQKPSGRAAHIECGEDNWEEIDEETIWRWLFFESLDKMPQKVSA